MTPDFDMAKRFLAAHAPPGKLVLVGVTGSHLYGFPSPDSDVDLKGIHAAPVHQLLGLDVPKETHDVLTDFEGVEHDLTTHEAARALSLLLRGNGNVLERILSPLQVIESDEVKALQSLARGSISKSFAGHYRGFFKGMRREHDLRRRAKSMLYSYRVALTGVHLLKTGKLEASLIELAPRYGFESVLELCEFKAEAGEKSTLPEEIDQRHRERWDELDALLGETLAASTLSESAPNRDAMNEWLIALRKTS